MRRAGTIKKKAYTQSGRTRMRGSDIVIANRKDMLPESVRWHIQHRPYSDIGPYGQPCDRKEAIY